MAKKVLFFDSGIGGLTTLAETLKLCPTLSYIYVADNLHAPFGALTKKQLSKHVKHALKPYLNSTEIGLIVLACNTATYCVLDELKQLTKTPIIGTEPAIVQADRNVGSILVLATPTTLMQPKYELLSSFATNKIYSVPMAILASLIDDYAQTKNASINKQIDTIITNLYIKYPHVQTVVLGCTHYSFIKNKFKKIFNVPCLDSNLEVANNVLKIVSRDNTFFSGSKSFPQIITTKPTKCNYSKILKEILTSH